MLPGITVDALLIAGTTYCMPSAMDGAGDWSPRRDVGLSQPISTRSGCS
jgi:hypothetical protein